MVVYTCIAVYIHLYIYPYTHDCLYIYRCVDSFMRAYKYYIIVADSCVIIIIVLYLYFIMHNYLELFDDL